MGEKRRRRKSSFHQIKAGQYRKQCSFQRAFFCVKTRHVEILLARTKRILLRNMLLAEIAHICACHCIC
jgi:hypothetical protein